MARRIVAWCVVVSLTAAAHEMRAQSTRLLLTSGALIFPSPGLANYQHIPAGATTPVTDSVAVAFTVERTADSYRRFSTVKLRCVLVTGGKPCNLVQWRTQAGGSWRDIVASDTDVDGRFTVPGSLNDPWGGTIWLRMKLSWSDAPATYNATIAVTMDVNRP